MSHRKIRSQGYVPFSWEEKPGVPKISHQKSSSDIGLNAFSKILPDNFTNSSIIPPPPFSFQPPRKCYSRRLQDDPFLVALKSCSDSVSNQKGQEELRHKGNESKRKSYIKGSVFSCRIYQLRKQMTTILLRRKPT
ncbi:hypothetical protein CDL12_14340 [Handroanthus impetiginosus]|uniref:Uncharacterized protein n=1 Tax=Handroanthus impetiginosus TaxID=429701 RepID=A0A2G9H695_9LAMI|nr:hypothetical protein CDL12_14340 [Handroanthus impetiginosus]